MTQEEIIDYNRRCAEFLGMNNDALLLAKQIEKNTGICHLKFHSDWNWIHEIIDAIEKLKTETSTFDFYIQPKSVLIKEERNYSFEKRDGGRTSQPLKFNDSVWITGKTKKEAVVQAINQFLIWYNNGKTN